MPQFEAILRRIELGESVINDAIADYHPVIIDMTKFDRRQEELSWQQERASSHESSSLNAGANQGR